jgi:excinuclease ABC subunit C
MSGFDRKKLLGIPHVPGVYQMKDKNGTILYVGKAKNLKKRVSSYFSSKLHDVKTRVLVSLIDAVDVITTNTENEALILENQLIKTFKPKYNILLKDDKTYPYIKITKDLFPKISVTRKKLHDGATYYGPYPSIGSTRFLRRMLLDMFPIRDCKQEITLNKMQKKCLLLDIGKCIAPCVKKEVKKEYDDLITQLMMLLSGKDKTLIKNMKHEMAAFSSELKFEKAAEIRDRINKCQQLLEKQRVDLDLRYNAQIWAVHESDDYFYLLIQDIIDGKLLYQFGFIEQKNKITDVTDLVEQAVYEHIGNNGKKTKEIYCDSSLLPVIKESVQAIKEKIGVKAPKKGEKKEWVKNAETNAKLALLKHLKSKTEKKETINVCEELKHVLRLAHCPERIIGFDISHLQGTNIVASAVYFKDGKPYKSLYRKFNIKTVSGKSNDPMSIKEVVLRRLQLCQKQNEPTPNLLLIDGGRGQLNYAVTALSSLGLLGKIDIISLAKKEEEIYTLHFQTPIRLPHSHPGLHLLQYIRDESHRFALTFQRSKRKYSNK